MAIFAVKVVKLISMTLPERPKIEQNSGCIHKNMPRITFPIIVCHLHNKIWSLFSILGSPEANRSVILQFQKKCQLENPRKLQFSCLLITKCPRKTQI